MRLRVARYSSLSNMQQTRRNIQENKRTKQRNKKEKTKRYEKVKM